MWTASGCMHCWLLIMSCKCPRAVLLLASSVIYTTVSSSELTAVKFQGRYLGLHYTVKYSRSRQRWLTTVFVLVHQLFFKLMPVFWSYQSLGRELDCCVRDEWVKPSLSNQPNAAIADQLCCNLLLQFIQFIGRSAWSDLVLVRKMLGSSSLCGCLCSLPWATALQPCFCFLSLLRLGLLPAGMGNHREPNILALSASILCEQRNSTVTHSLVRNPIFQGLCQL